jgi:anti-sigma regulatory factor (Ser/Thr protein kinase)
MPGSRYENESARLAPGDLLLLYTDGVTESMNPASVMFGEEQLAAIAQREHRAATRVLIEAIVRAVHVHAAGTEQSDDITLLAVRVQTYPDAAGQAASSAAPLSRLTLANRRDELPRLAAWIEEQAGALSFSAPLAMSLNLALEEWVVNIISYAYADAAAHAIELRLWSEPGRLRIEIEDDGRPFDPTVHAAPDTDAPLEFRKIGGLGIHFIRKTVDEMRYHRRDNHNLLTLVKQLPAGGTPPEAGAPPGGQTGRV